jgi:lysine/ornithine N-monooxygenase
MLSRLSPHLQSLNFVAYCMHAMAIKTTSCSARPSDACDVAIVGAGPYGLSIAAHLKARKIRFRIFGRPMDSWRSNMPAGMLLKSDGFASNLYDPQGIFTLKQFCTDRGLEYSDTVIPVPLETFCAYGLAFAERFVPELEENNVEQIEAVDGGFALRLDSGESLFARRVVLAVGITHFPHIPKNLTPLPDQFLSHSAAHHDLTPFRGQSVAVVGGGASAINLAYLLKDVDANVELIVRDSNLIFSGKPQKTKRSLLQHLRHPPSGLGPGWRSRFCTDAPLLFHLFPQEFRQEIVRRHLGPAGAWHSKERVIGRLPVHTGCAVERAEVQDGKVRLSLVAKDGSHREVVTGHVIAATGYRADVNRLRFLSEDIRSRIRMGAGSPILSATFESSVSGLYFTGLAAANSFGPMLRFAYGAGFTARRLSAALSKSMARDEKTEILPPLAMSGATRI